MIKILLVILAAMSLWYSVIFIKDLLIHKNDFEKQTDIIKSGAIGFGVNFFDTLGIGSFAPATFLLKYSKQIKDRVIPGTLNVSCTLPIVAQAFIFMSIIEVDSLTLVSLIAAATLGAWVGAGFVASLPEKNIQLSMGFALLATFILMISSLTGVLPSAGTAIGLTGWKLGVGIIGNFILGILMTLGIGLYAPCMAMIYFLGMSPIAAFPIMMGSCAFLMPVASVKFIKEGAYNRKASYIISIMGIIAVLIAAYIVKNLPIKMLSWIVAGVIFYTSGIMFISYKKTSSEESPNLIEYE